MLLRISLGLWSYVIVSVFFQEAFNLLSLGLTIFFVLLPLADWAPYLLLRKKYKLVSHYLWYYPLVYMPVGAIIIYAISGNGYYVELFAISSLANFIHATFQTPMGLEWLWPFSRASLSLYGNELMIFSEEEKQACMQKKYEQYAQRSLKRRGEQGMRTLTEELSDRMRPSGRKTKVFSLVSVVLVLVFWLSS
jgi:hypothetical protein